MPSTINVPPTLQVPVMTNTKPDKLQYFTWSLIPSFSKTGKAEFKMSTFNATIERLKESSLWKPLLGPAFLTAENAKIWIDNDLSYDERKH